MSKDEVTVSTLLQMKRRGEKIAVLTSYDASFTAVAEAAGVDVLLVGDSLGMVIQGEESTLPVTVDDMVYHTRIVSRARTTSLLIADMPYRSYENPEQALQTGKALTQAGGARLVKLEGGAEQIETVACLVANGLPVCAHLGLLPQSAHKSGGYKVQGRDPDAARKISDDALALQQAGASLLVLECVPATLASEISAALAIPVIGIGAGAGCDGQVLVLYDMLGITPRRMPRFVKNFLAGTGNVQAAIAAYVAAVKAGTFPAPEHCY